jgi:hypothetical protein
MPAHGALALCSQVPGRRDDEDAVLPRLFDAAYAKRIDLVGLKEFAIGRG